MNRSYLIHVAQRTLSLCVSACNHHCLVRACISTRCLARVCVCVCVCVPPLESGIRVFQCALVALCTCGCLHLCMHAYTHACMQSSLVFTCMLFICKYLCMHACMYGCFCAWMHSIVSKQACIVMIEARLAISNTD